MNRITVGMVIVLVLLLAAVAYAATRARSTLPGPAGTGAATTTDTSQAPGPITSGEDPGPPGGVHNQPVEPAAAAARQELAAQLGVAATSIVIMEVSEETWNNGCLGLAKAGEFCTMALVPGFRVELLAQGKIYVYRTDRTGANVRAEAL